MKHRQIDSQRLVQRNKNLLQDILEKQATEQRRTIAFLKFALGKREDKSEAEITAERRQKSYNPMNDPMMPRLFRKVSHQMGRSTARSTVTSASKHASKMGDSAENWKTQVSIYDNLDSISKIQTGDKYTLV